MSTDEKIPPPPDGAIPEPDITAAHRREAHRMSENYRDDRPTTVLPGSNGMISGTAITDWLDENGDSRFDR
ncbi:hypothetical protein ACIP5Y_16590 [Nocardia sp. NPDC088792]|uniref:hypothetical protein n=1 Tax=Nocardia sp. NPDC088792 TaxID=3364332 RepID=UPI00382048E3